MEATRITFEIPQGILQTLNQTQKEFIYHMRLFTALQLFRNHKLSFGQAAELAGMRRQDLLTELDNHDIDLIAYDASELEEELERFDS